MTPMIRNALRLFLLVSAGCLTLPASAALPFAKGDPKQGEGLVHKAKCDAACHVQIVGGDGTGLYTRQQRRVKNPEALSAQVRFCATQLNTSWFPEEEDNVAAYLNQRYYKFK